MSDAKPDKPRASRSRLLHVDDHPVVRQGLARLIEREPDLAVCGEVESAHDALEMVGRLRPDLAVVDLSLQGKPGLELIKDLQTHHPSVRVLVLSMHDESLWAERVLRAGACGYVMKQEKPQFLLAKIRQALRGEIALSDHMTEMLLRKVTTGSAPQVIPEEALGDRELQVLQLIGQGLSSREIAAAMHISVKTVEAHREHIKRKLNLSSGDDLLRYAVVRFLGASQR